MKKMVCEICDSTKIKKVGNVFVCQECGTEYDLESARGLLKDIGNNDGDGHEVQDNKEVLSNNDNKYVLLNYLKSWYEVVDAFNNMRFWIDTDDVENFYEDYDKVKSLVLDAKKEKIPFIEKEWFYSEFSDKYKNDSFSEMSRKINGLYALAFNPHEAFGLHPIVRKYDEIFLKYDLDYVWVANIQYPKYLFSTSEVGEEYAWNDMAFKYKWWLELADKNKVKRLYSYRNFCKQGLFFQKLERLRAEHIINSSEFFNDVSTLYNEICERHRLLVFYYNNNFEEMKNVYVNLIKEVDELQKEFNLPIKYRDIGYISSLIEYIKDGRVDSWKEAINLLEKEIFQDKLLNAMDKISSIFKDIDEHLKTGLMNINTNLQRISLNIANLSATVQKSAVDIKKIQKDTRRTMLSVL